LDLLEKISGAKILLVDDSEINQQLAKEILSNWGMSVTLANNGQESIERLEAENFDLVLMDIQMPIMDGYEATQIIRSQLNLSAIPIVAMTAHAMQGDREKMIAIGMSDYISKPFKLESFFTTLEKCLHSNPGYREKHSDRIKKLETGIQHSNLKQQINIELLKPIKGINLSIAMENTGNNKKLFYRLLTLFKERLDNDAVLVTELIEKKDTESAYGIVHNIKGISGNLGAEKLSNASAKLLNCLINNDSKLTTQSLEEYNACVKILQSSLDNGCV